MHNNMKMARYKYTRWHGYISLDLGNVPVTDSLSLSSKLTLSHALLPDAGPGTLQTPFLLCLASPCWHLPWGALQTSKLGREQETCSIPPLSRILQAASVFCAPRPAMLHHLGSNRSFPGSIWIQFAVLSNTWKSSFIRLCLPRHQPAIVSPSAAWVPFRPLLWAQTLSTRHLAFLPRGLRGWVWASQGLASEFLSVSLCSITSGSGSSCFLKLLFAWYLRVSVLLF